MSSEVSISELNRRYLATVDWASTPNDVSKMQSFRSTVMSLIAIRPSSVSKGAASRIEFDQRVLQEQLKEVNRAINSYNTDDEPERTYFDVRRFRS